MVEQLRTKSLFQLEMEMDDPVTLSGHDGTKRLIYKSAGGTFAGARLRGHVLPVTGDWVSLSKSSMEVDVRVELETDDQALIVMSYAGVHQIDSSQSDYFVDGRPAKMGANYFRVAPTFRTKDPRYGWINTITTLGMGTRSTRGVVYDFVELL